MQNKIWTPEDSNPKPTPQDKQVKIEGTIINAKYHPLQKALIIAVRLPNGEARSCVDYANSHTFHGRPYKDVPSEEIDREMEKTAELYCRRKGGKISLQIYENQIGSAWDQI